MAAVVEEMPGANNGDPVSVAPGSTRAVPDPAKHVARRLNGS